MTLGHLDEAAFARQTAEISRLLVEVDPRYRHPAPAGEVGELVECARCAAMVSATSAAREQHADFHARQERINRRVLALIADLGTVTGLLGAPS